MTGPIGFGSGCGCFQGLPSFLDKLCDLLHLAQEVWPDGQVSADGAEDAR